MSTREAVNLQLSRRFAAPREQVFDAWTNPEVLRQWWSAGDDWSTPAAEVDLREGGRYRLSMQTPAGEVHTVGGEYTEVRRPERLSYTWAWEGGPPEMEGSAETLVVVDFVDEGGSTEVMLTHSGFANDEIRAMHAEGWEAVLASLERRVFS
jgi:uncharacterized protein YndB with AHSA1/START domain